MNLQPADLLCKRVAFLNKAAAYMVFPALTEDPIAKDYANNVPANEYMLQVMDETTAPGDLVMDFGCHIGSFSIGAAALGRGVIAVDANPDHVDWVRKAARVNEFTNIVVLHNALSTSDDPIRFVANGLWGAIDFSGSGAGAMVETRKVDEVVRSFAEGRRVAFVKMDIEGAETEAMRTASRLLREDQPVILFESNGMTLEVAGSSVPELRRFFESVGYKVFRVQGGEWIYAPPDEIQPEAWVDMVAISERDQARWSDRLRRTWEPAEILQCCETWAALPHSNTRAYLAEEISRREIPPSIAPALEAMVKMLSAPEAAPAPSPAPSQESRSFWRWLKRS